MVGTCLSFKFRIKESLDSDSGHAAVAATSIGPAGRHVTSATGLSSPKPRKEQVSAKI